MNDQNNKRANILCWISLACAIGPWVLWKVLGELLFYPEESGKYSILLAFSNVYGAFTMFTWLIAMVLMIYVRVKYPKNKFGIILMVLYILIIIFVIAVVIFIVTLCNSCGETITSCGWFSLLKPII